MLPQGQHTRLHTMANLGMPVIVMHVFGLCAETRESRGNPHDSKKTLSVGVQLNGLGLCLWDQKVIGSRSALVNYFYVCGSLGTISSYHLYGKPGGARHRGTFPTGITLVSVLYYTSIHREPVGVSQCATPIFFKIISLLP